MFPMLQGMSVGKLSVPKKDKKRGVGGAGTQGDPPSVLQKDADMKELDENLIIKLQVN